MKTYIWIVLVILILAIIFFIFRKNDLPITHSPKNNVDTSDETSEISGSKSPEESEKIQAILIARRELGIRQREGLTYNLLSVEKYYDNSGKWQIVFDSDEVTDSSIAIVVDMKSKTVVSYDQHQE